MKVVAIIAAAFLIALVAVVANFDGPCNLTDDGIAACRPSVTGEKPVNPSEACCTALAKADLKCLCFFKNNYPWLLSAYNIDPKVAMQLPGKCKIVGESFSC